MLHACVQKFDVRGTVGTFQGTKRRLNYSHSITIVSSMYASKQLHYLLLQNKTS